MRKQVTLLSCLYITAITILGFLFNCAAAAEIALYQGKDRQAKIEEGAKREGEVVWYTSFQTDDANQFIKMFEKRYPSVKVKLTRMTSERVLQRYLMEYQGNAFLADIIDTNDFQMELPRRKGTLQPYYTPSTQRFDKRFLQPQGYWVGSRLTMIVNGFNTQLVKPGEVPKKYEDLLDPKWKGKMSLEREQTEWFMALMEHWGEEKGKAFFQKLGTQNAKIRNGHTLMAQLIMAGEDPMSPNAYSHHFPGPQKQGAPVDWVNLEPVIGKAIVSALAKNAPHPHAAMLFIDYFFSSEGGQKVVQEANRIPTHPDLAPNPSRLREGFDFIIVDPSNYMDKINHYEKLWREWVIKGP
jgi:iron(III) transport system substrate-binding protein